MGVARRTHRGSHSGTRDPRVAQVAKLFYSATKRSVNLIPIGTYYSFRLIGDDGGTIAFGNRVGNLSELSDRLLTHTYTPLFNKIAPLFDSGVDVDFGDIAVNRQDGVRVKRFLGKKWIPWEKLQEYRIESGHFLLWTTGQKYGSGPELRRVPDAFVLAGLLDAALGVER